MCRSSPSHIAMVVWRGLPELRSGCVPSPRPQTHNTVSVTPAGQRRKLFVVFSLRLVRIGCAVPAAVVLRTAQLLAQRSAAVGAV